MQSPPELPGWAFHVFGQAAPQGSKSFKGMSKAGRAILAESSKKVAPWRSTVTAAAVGAGPCLDGPLAVAMVFTVPRPAGATKRTLVPDRLPDLGKLARAAEDSITAAGLWADDARVSTYVPLAKAFPSMPYPGIPADAVLAVPGLLVAAVSIAPEAPAARSRPAAPPPEVLAAAASRLGVARAAVLALAAGRPLTAERVDAWAAERAADPDRFSEIVAAARAWAAKETEIARELRAAPAVLPDPAARIAALLAAEAAKVRAELGRWRAGAPPSSAA
jgi:crossover junction endodeoxyribonuclease RusA